MEIQGQASVINRKIKSNAQFAQRGNGVLSTLLWVCALNGVFMGSVVLDDTWFFKGIVIISFEQVLSDLLER